LEIVNIGIRIVKAREAEWWPQSKAWIVWRAVFARPDPDDPAGTGMGLATGRDAATLHVVLVGKQ
jgi:hypothetical protein